MDKQTESRKQFEEWVMSISSGCADLTLTIHGPYDSWEVERYWEAWQASRESLVVELPKREAFESYPHESYMIDDDNGKYIPYAETVEALRSIGIRIKGEGV
ncbi:hypothetical protein [Serratia fonticola]